MGGGMAFTPRKPAVLFDPTTGKSEPMLQSGADWLRREALDMALRLNPGATSEQVIRDAERFFAFVQGVDADVNAAT